MPNPLISIVRVTHRAGRSRAEGGSACAKLRPALMAGILWLVPCWALPAQSPSPDDAKEAAFQAASELYHRQKWVAAAEAFEAYLENGTELSEEGRARFYLAESLVQMGAHRQAHAELTTLAEQLEQVPTPMRARVLFRRGETAYFLGLEAEAERALSEFVRQHSDSELVAYALPYLADLTRRRGNFAAAFELYEKAIARFPKGQATDDCRFGRAECRRRLGDVAAARIELDELQRTGVPRIAAESLYALGLLEYSCREFEAAASRLSSLIERYPESRRIDQACYWLGIVHFAAGQDAKAVQVLTVAEKQLAANSRSSMEPSCWFFLAEALRRNGQPEQARWRYERLLGQSPDHPRAEQARQALQTLQSNRHVARRSGAAELGPTPPETLRRAARLADHRRWGEALKLIDGEGTERRSNLVAADATLLAARCLVELEQNEAARARLDQLLLEPTLLTADSQAEAQLLFAESFCREGACRRAAREYLRVDALAGEVAWRERAVREASRCYARLGRHEAAARLLARADALAVESRRRSQAICQSADAQREAG